MLHYYYSVDRQGGVSFNTAKVRVEIMNVILYCENTKNIGQRFQDNVVSNIPKNMRISLDTPHGLRVILQECNNDDVAMLCITSREEFEKVYELRKLLLNHPLILILPVDQEDIIPRGYELRPRFVEYCDSEFHDVAVVVAHLMEESGITSRSVRK